MLNPVVLATPCELARTYVTSSFSETDQHRLLPIIDLFGQGKTSAAWSLMEERALEFNGLESFRRYRQFTALLKKVPWKRTDFDREGRAISSFWKSESRCRRTNRRFRFYRSHTDRIPEAVRVVLSRAREYTRMVLGDLTVPKYHAMLALARPGGGVAVGTQNRYRTSPTYKYVATDLAVTSDARTCAYEMILSKPFWWKQVASLGEDGVIRVPIQSVPGARVAFVPKDGRSLRSIAVEPSLNVMLQLGVHEYIRKRLHDYASTDIGDQTLNQKLSFLASKSSGLGGTMATIDLASASDSISIELVRELVPSSWFDWLNAIRCDRFSLNGELITSEKFSTMGNGFTFALETLLFKALAEGCISYVGCGGITSCYGDDIIVPDECALLLTEVLKWCGLVVNSDKSYYHGPFRESCGTDWYEGRNVTPLYIREERVDMRTCYRLLNSWGSRPGSAGIKPFLLGEMRKSGKILYGLENEDESSCLFTTLAYAKGGGHVKYHVDWQTFRFKGLVEKAPKDKGAPVEWLYLSSLLTGMKGDLSLRGVTQVTAQYLTPGNRPRVWHELTS